MKNILFFVAGTFLVSNIAIAAPKAIPHDSLLNLVQAKMSNVLKDVRVTSSTSFNPISICGSPEQVFYTLHLEVRKKVRTGAATFEDQWEIVKVYHVSADEVDGKDESDLAKVQLFDPETCAE